MNNYRKKEKPFSLDKSLRSAKSRELKRIESSITSNPTLKNFNFRAYKTTGIKDFLKKENHNKCCYCGSLLVDSQSHSHVEHYRPKRDTPNSLQLDSNGLGYYWLAAEWDNLLLSCEICNTNKGTRFPLKNNQNRYINSRSIHFEEPMILNFRDKAYKPEDHFIFDYGNILPQSAEALETINTCELYRTELVERRNGKRVSLETECNTFLKILKKTQNQIIMETIEYREDDLNWAKHFYEHHLKNFPNIRNEFSAMESQIIREKLLTSTNWHNNYKTILNAEEERIKIFKMKNP